MAKFTEDRKCEKCQHSSEVVLVLPDKEVVQELHCYSPQIVQTYENGISCVAARGPGRFCGPRGEAFDARR